MRLLSSLNGFAIGRAVPTNVPPAHIRPNDGVTWRDSFDQAINMCNATGQLMDMSIPVCGCMQDGDVDVLRDILLLQDLRSLSIRGPMDPRAWTTFVEAMPESLSISSLSLSNLDLDDFTARLLFQAIGKMPLVNLSLQGVGVPGGLKEPLERPDLNELKTLSVIEAGYGEPGDGGGGKATVSPVLLKILEGCKPRSLSITGMKFEVSDLETHKSKSAVVTVRQTASLALALSGQTGLERLRMTRCRDESICHDSFGVMTRSHLVQVSPSVYSMPSLRMLDLSGNSLSIKVTTSIVNSLASGTNLRHLYLNGNYFDSATLRAVANLLKTNKTLLSISFESAIGYDGQGNEHEYLVDENELEQLTDALKQNKSLRRLRFGVVPGLDCSELFGYLDRNRQLFMAACSQGGMHAVLNSSRHRVPNDVVRHFSDEGARYMSLRDTLNLSSVNKAAWARRLQVISEGDPSN